MAQPKKKGKSRREAWGRKAEPAQKRAATQAARKKARPVSAGTGVEGKKRVKFALGEKDVGPGERTKRQRSARGGTKADADPTTATKRHKAAPAPPSETSDAEKENAAVPANTPAESPPAITPRSCERALARAAEAAKAMGLTGAMELLESSPAAKVASS